MDYESIVRDLLSYRYEEEWFEFKSSWYEPEGIGQYISSLSNAAAYVGRKEGYLVWGVDNETHTLTDTTFNWQVDVKNEPLQHFLARQITPDIDFSFHEATIENKRVVILVIPAAKGEPTSFQKIRYIRVGSSKVNLDRFPARQAHLYSILSNGFPTIVNTEAFITDLTFDSLFEVYRKASLPLKKETFEHNLQLRTKKGEYNILAQLLSDNSLMSIRIVQFTGDSKTSPLYAVRNVGDDCLINSFRKLMAYGDILNVMQADERNRFAERKEIPLFDAAVYREAVINALVHNDWLGGNGPAINVFNNRIEIVSNGSLPPNQTIEGFFSGQSVPRNVRLADIFMQLRISERSGRGILLITEKYGREAITILDNSITVTIPYSRISITGSPDSAGDNVLKEVEALLEKMYRESPANQKAPVNHPENVMKNDDSLSPVRQKILSLMAENPGVSMKFLSEQLGISDTSVEKNVRFLKERGYITREGNNRSGRWKVLK